MEFLLKLIARKSSYYFNYVKRHQDDNLLGFLHKYENEININNFNYNNCINTLPNNMYIIVDHLCSAGMVEEAEHFLKLMYACEVCEYVCVTIMTTDESRSFNRLKTIFELL